MKSFFGVFSIRVKQPSQQPGPASIKVAGLLKQGSENRGYPDLADHSLQTEVLLIKKQLRQFWKQHSVPYYIDVFQIRQRGTIARLRKLGYRVEMFRREEGKYFYKIDQR